MSGKLYIVATPIGNLEDITLRAIRILGEADFIASEDTRTTAKLLAKYNIKKPLIAYFQHSRRGRLEHIISHLQQGKNIAYVSEAGTPAISDPGSTLVTKVLEEGLQVVAIPGPSALSTAISVAGFPADKFIFEGFLPRKRGKRKETLLTLEKLDRTLVFFESPYRLIDTLKDILAVLGDKPTVVARELTKLYEEIRLAPLTNHIEHFSKKGTRGEFTIVVSNSL